jgi:hypothetical protein
MNQDALHTPGLSSRSTELTVLEEAGVANILKMSHVSHVVVSSLRPCEFNSKSLKAPGFTACADELPLIYPLRVPNVFQVRHISHAQVRYWWIELDLEPFQSPGLTLRTYEIVVRERIVSNAF